MPKSKLGIISLWSHTGDKIAMYSQNLWQRGLNGESTNYDTTDSTGVEGFELAWEERDMLINQLYGKHRAHPSCRGAGRVPPRARR